MDSLSKSAQKTNSETNPHSRTGEKTTEITHQFAECKSDFTEKQKTYKNEHSQCSCNK